MCEENVSNIIKNMNELLNRKRKKTEDIYDSDMIHLFFMVLML